MQCVVTVVTLLFGCFLGIRCNMMSSQYRDFIMNKYNQYRNMKEESNNWNLVWSESLAQAADNWLSNCRFEHQQSPNNLYGENMAFYTGSDITENMEQAFQDWYQYYSYFRDNGAISSRSNQMNWYQAREVGCAYRRCPSLFSNGRYVQNAWYFVCRYNPGGFVKGQYGYGQGSGFLKTESETFNSQENGWNQGSAGFNQEMGGFGQGMESYEQEFGNFGQGMGSYGQNMEGYEQEFGNFGQGMGSYSQGMGGFVQGTNAFNGKNGNMGEFSQGGENFNQDYDNNQQGNGNNNQNAETNNDGNVETEEFQDQTAENNQEENQNNDENEETVSVEENNESEDTSGQNVENYQSSGSGFGGCVDMNDQCSSRAADGQCESNSGYMATYCRQSCNFCQYLNQYNGQSGVCMDQFASCLRFAFNCQASEVMKTYCPVTCGFC